MRNKSLLLRLSGAVLALALVGIACASDTGDTATQEPGTGTETSAPEEGPAEEPSAEIDLSSGGYALEQTLTALLQEHEYLAGIAVVQGVSNGLDSPQFAAAAEALGNNSKALADAVASVYGDAAGEQFLPLWEKHIGFFVNYTKGKATGDDALVRKSRKQLNDYRTDFGAFLESATEGNLPADAVADALKPHVQSTFAAIDAVVAGDTSAFMKLREAAGHMPGIATAVAGGIAAQQGLDGVDTPAANLQRDLTALLQEHEYLAGIAVAMGVGNGLDSPQFAAAAETLGANSKALADAVASIYGDAAGEQFLPLWEKHIGFFVNYTKGKATGDDALVRKSRKQLNDYRTDFGAFLESATEGILPADAVADALKPHVESTFAAIDSIVTGKGNPFELLRRAAGHMPGIATALAGAFVQQFPDQFGS